MTLQEQMKAEKIIQTIAQEAGKQPHEVRKAMQEALDAAWTAGHAPGNLRGQLTWQRLFPGNRKPSVEEFIIRLANEAQT